jgi:hypothetical protein
MTRRCEAAENWEEASTSASSVLIGNSGRDNDTWQSSGGGGNHHHRLPSPILAALLFFILTKTMIGVGALALVVAGACARRGLGPI